MSDFNDDHDTDAMLEAADVERNGRYTDAQLERDIALLSRFTTEGARMRRNIGAIAAFLAFVSTVWFANYVVDRYGIVNVGFGLMGPAAVYVIGVAFTLRDILHRLAGPYVVMAAVILGASLSYLISPTFAFASGVAFLVSELADLAVYTPLERKSWIGAVTLSNTVGLVLDSLLFLWLAFGSLEFFWGQCLGKAWMTLAAVVLIAVARYGHRALQPRLA